MIKQEKSQLEDDTTDSFKQLAKWAATFILVPGGTTYCMKEIFDDMQRSLGELYNGEIEDELERERYAGYKFLTGPIAKSIAYSGTAVIDLVKVWGMYSIIS